MYDLFGLKFWFFRENLKKNGIFEVLNVIFLLLRNTGTRGRSMRPVSRAKKWRRKSPPRSDAPRMWWGRFRWRRGPSMSGTTFRLIWKQRPPWWSTISRRASANCWRRPRGWTTRLTWPRWRSWTPCWALWLILMCWWTIFQRLMRSTKTWVLWLNGEKWLDQDQGKVNFVLEARQTSSKPIRTRLTPLCQSRRGTCTENAFCVWKFQRNCAKNETPQGKAKEVKYFLALNCFVLFTGQSRIDLLCNSTGSGQSEEL